MFNQRYRAIVWAGVALAGIWLMALTGRWVAAGMKVTAEKVAAYVDRVDLSKLTGAERARAIQRLADMLNKLTPEERRRMRLGRTAEGWFVQMTEEEKGAFIEATMPTGFKQMISAFEEQPPERRRRAIDESLKRLREANSQMDGERALTGGDTNRPPLSPELEAKIRTIGLKTFYSQSSAQTKAELAPLLEELQRAMESGRMMRGRP